jgi:hypothetical protein
MVLCGLKCFYLNFCGILLSCVVVVYLSRDNVSGTMLSLPGMCITSMIL